MHGACDAGSTERGHRVCMVRVMPAAYRERSRHMYLASPPRLSLVAVRGSPVKILSSTQFYLAARTV